MTFPRKPAGGRRHRPALGLLSVALAAVLVAACTAAPEAETHVGDAAAESAESQEVSNGSAPIDPAPHTANPAPAAALTPRLRAPRCDHPASTWDRIDARGTAGTAGYASLDSALPGETVGLYVSTPAASFRVEAYRMGFYQRDVRACQVWESAPTRGGLQHAAVILGKVHEPTARWHRSLTVPTKGWRPGDYLLRIDGGGASLRALIPLTVRSPSFAGRVVLIMPDTTWQAYNMWGDYSLYFGPGHVSATRARTVSFDRPYGYGLGAADFIDEELPLVTLAESIGVPLAYATDVDLQREPAAFATARAVISVGHDEYYSPTMRAALTSARDAGVNLAFFGSNDIYRKIRFASSPLGADRLVINYKDATDPIRTPSLVTTQWPAPPSNDPESSLTGDAYRCASAVFYPTVVVDAGNWLFDGTGVRDGLALDSLAGHEFDGVNPGMPMPHPLEVLFHSPARCYGRSVHQDSTYYTTPSQAGVLDVGAYFWTCAIGNTCRTPITPQTTRIVIQMTTNFLLAAAAGPLGRTRQAKDTVGRVYPKPIGPRWR